MQVVPTGGVWVWVVVHVCALLRDAEEGPWQRARLEDDEGAYIDAPAHLPSQQHNHVLLNIPP